MAQNYGGPGSTDPYSTNPSGTESTSGSNPMGETEKQVVNRFNNTADDLMSRGRELYEKGNQRRFILEHDGRVMINLPLTVAAILGLIITVVAPWAAVLGVLAALFTRVRIRIEGEGL
jgi:hypothetical protein